MVTHPLLLELWIRALCELVNGHPGYIPVSDSNEIEWMVIDHGTPYLA